ncbi:hypothetical protein BJX62DRAFT_236544 [Aspergillus germanicus]
MATNSTKKPTKANTGCAGCAYQEIRLAPNNASRKRKAEDDLNNRRAGPNVEEPLAETSSTADPTTQPAPQSPSPNSQDPAGSCTHTNNPNASRVVARQVPPERSYVGIKIKLDDDTNTGGSFVSVEELQSDELLDLPRVAHTTGADGTPETVIISIQRRGILYHIVFSKLPQDQERKIAHECMDLYVQDDYEGVADLLLPLCYDAFDQSDNSNPILANSFESFLRSSVLSDVKSFRPHTSTNMLYEVEFEDQSEPLVFKMMERTGPLCQEFMTLQKCEELNIRAPRIKALLSVGTKWGGFVMSRIKSSFCLHDWHSESISAPLDDRKRWFQQISEAVQALHRVDYIWGDTKSSNVLIDQDGNACLIDFEGGSSLD